MRYATHSRIGHTRVGPIATLVAALGVAGAFAACHVGPRAETWPPAHDPHGAPATLRAHDATVRGELLAAGDSGLFVLRDGAHIVFVPYKAIDEGSVATVDANISGRNAPTTASQAALRLASRFPQGLSVDLQTRLLAAYQQDSMITVGQ